MVLARSALPTNYVTTHAIATHRPLHSPRLQKWRQDWQHHAGKESYVIMATKTGPHAVSTILPIA
jgi:hypothetical protein